MATAIRYELCSSINRDHSIVGMEHWVWCVQARPWRYGPRFVRAGAARSEEGARLRVEHETGNLAAELEGLGFEIVEG